MEDKLNIALLITMILINFAIAFTGVIIMFHLDVWLGFGLAVAGIALAIKTMGRA
jgi:hypothetical protein